MARRKRKISQPKRKVFAIIGDGKTEMWYFQMLKRNERGIQVNISPKIPQRKKMQEQFNEILDLAKYYDEVYWIIDLDVIIKESKETGKSKKTPIQRLKEYISSLLQYKNVTVILINPCFEFWLLLHFEKTTKHYTDCNSVIRKLKKYLPDYEKTPKYYTKMNGDIFLRLKDNLQKAIENSKSISKNNTDNYKYFERGICQMHLLFEKIGKI